MGLLGVVRYGRWRKSTWGQIRESGGSAFDLDIWVCGGLRHLQSTSKPILAEQNSIAQLGFVGFVENNRAICK